MKRYLIAALAALTLLAIPATASAHPHGWQRCSGYTSGLTPADVGFTLDQYRGYNMNCASVRYAAKHLRKRMERANGRTYVSFHDGYVRWQCGGFDNGVKCWENTSGTSFKAHLYYW